MSDSAGNPSADEAFASGRTLRSAPLPFSPIRGQAGQRVEGRAMVVNILLWCLFGLIAGMVARFIMPGKGGGAGGIKGLAVTATVGIVGAVVGGFVASQLFNWDVTGFNLPSLAIAILGALLVLFLYRILMTGKGLR